MLAVKKEYNYNQLHALYSTHTQYSIEIERERGEGTLCQYTAHNSSLSLARSLTQSKSRESRKGYLCVCERERALSIYLTLSST